MATGQFNIFQGDNIYDLSEDIPPPPDANTAYIKNLTGDNPYLSNGNMNRDGKVSFYPRLTGNFKTAVEGMTLDGPILQEEKFFGQPGASVGFFEKLMPSFPDYDGILISRLVIKKPGTFEYTLPASLHEADPLLVPLLSELAADEWASSRYAFHRAALLAVRKIPIRKGWQQIGNYWHLDNRPDKLLDKKKFSIPDEDWDVISCLSKKLHRNFHTISNKYSFRFQTARSRRRLVIGVDNDGLTRAGGLSPVPNRQAHDHEAVQTNSLNFHRAVNFSQDAINEEQLEEHRIALFVEHACPRYMESWFN